MYDRDELCRIVNADRLPGFPRLSPDSPLPTLVVWLQANDANGSYTPEECALNGYNPLTIDTAWRLIAESVD
jgi:hypothetical protein